MDRTPGNRPADGSHAWEQAGAGNARQPGARLAAEHHGTRRKPRRTPAETPRGSSGNVRRPPGGKHHGLLGETHGTRPETCGGHTGNAQCPPGANAAGYGPPDSKAAGHWPFRRNAQQAGDAPLNACRVAWRANVPDFTPLSRADETVRGRRTRQYVGGRTDRRASQPAGRAGLTRQPISRSQVPRSQIPARSIGNDDYPFTYGPVT